MRAIWTGAIGFGLVNIPIKIYSASQESSLNLDMLDKKDLSNIRFARINQTTGKEVSWGDIVKAYKYNNEYIVLTEKDFERANAKKPKVIEIVAFINEHEIDSIYYENPYYLEPEKSGTRAYTLLREALKKTKKVGIATYVLRNKESIGVIKPMNNVIVLNKIRFPEEIRSTKDLELPADKDVKGKELDMAITLIDQLTRRFNISAYKDTYASQLMDIIEAKAKGKTPHYKPMKVVSTTSKDLISQLKASIHQKKKRAA